MKRFLVIFTCCVSILSAVLFVLNIEVTTRQGIDYELAVKKIPLYLKTLDFLDRHYNYKFLTRGILSGEVSDEGKAVKLLAWTRNNIRRNPPGLPVVDDHVWHIIVRGYGVNDQYQDVFSTLCNYAGLDAFFGQLYSDDRSCVKILSFVKLKGGWSVFDAYDGIYFRNRSGRVATVNNIREGDREPVSVLGEKIAYDYGPIFDNIPSVRFRDWIGSRPAIQSPARRFIIWLKSGFLDDTWN